VEAGGMTLRPGVRVSISRLVERVGTVKKVDGIYVVLKMDNGAEVLAVGTHLNVIPEEGNGQEK
jgi:hypothetical protein